jgi:hypothetical protein
MNQQAWIDQQDAMLADTIRRHGWSIQYVGGDTCSRPGCTCGPTDQPPFAYTVGLFGLGHPELLIVGVDPEAAVLVLNTLGNRVRGGEALLCGFPVTIDGWDHVIVPEPVPNPGEILLWANSFYDHPAGYSVPALQLTYDDDAGRFPWDDGFADAHLQPRPGTFTA